MNSITEELVLTAIRNLNLARRPEDQLQVSPSAPVFGPGSPLDSMGLVSLIIDIEELLFEKGYQVTLSDERAVSQKRSPFRDVPAMVTYINTLMAEHAS
jgi:acyl carrier protein